MRIRRGMGLLAVSVALTAAATAATNAELEEEVRAAESAFARSMASRDHAAFVSHLAEEAVFFGGGGRVSRGRAAVAAAWRPYFEGETAPFSWQPEEVAVLDSGTIAMSSGPVFDPSGRRTGTFNSVWRRETDGSWKIVLDRGCPPCDGAGAQAPALPEPSKTP